MKVSRWKRVFWIWILTAFYCISGGVAASFAADVDLDQNEEIQWVMGDLSALKTAAQTYYSDSKKDKSVPPLSSILAYFDDQSLPSNAKSLYSLKGNRTGWYVGYQAQGLKSETYRLLTDNANSLGLVGDDLNTPWKQGNTYIWSNALSLSGSSPTGTTASSETSNYTTNNYTTNNYTTDSGSSGTTIIQDDDNDAVDAAVGVAAVLVGTAALLNIIDDHDNYYYNYPGHPWYWHSAIVYRPVYYDRFFDHYYRPLPRPPRPYPRPVYRYNVPHAGYVAPAFRNSIDRAHHNYDPGRNRTILDRNHIDHNINNQKRINNKKTVNVNNINVNRNRGIQQGNRQGLQPRETPRLKNDVQRRAPENRNIRNQPRQEIKRPPQQQARPQIERREVERERPQIERREIERPQRERREVGGDRLRRR